MTQDPKGKTTGELNESLTRKRRDLQKLDSMYHNAARGRSHMTKQTSKKKIPASYSTITDGYTCDLCGKKTNRGHSIDSPNWATSGLDVDAITVRRKEGWSSPDGGDLKIEEYHICNDCWESKLVPWLQSQGASPTKEESDY